jgi:hypothetical protein
MRLQGHARQPTPQQVHLRYILALTCDYLGVRGTRPGVRGAVGLHAGRAARGRHVFRGLAVVVPTRRRYGPDRPCPAYAGMLIPGWPLTGNGSCIACGGLRQHVDAFHLDAQSGLGLHGSGLILD